MIYKVLDKEEIGRLKEELSLGLPGTAKVYVSSWLVFWPLGIHFVHLQHQNNCFYRNKINSFFLIMLFTPKQEAQAKKPEHNKTCKLVWMFEFVDIAL